MAEQRNDGFWAICKCGVRVKMAPKNLDKGTGRYSHEGCRTSKFEAAGTSMKVKGYRQQKWGDKETSTPASRKAAAAAKKAAKK